MTSDTQRDKTIHLLIGQQCASSKKRIVFTKDGVHRVKGSRNGSSWQTRMASECGPMRPQGGGMNQGQKLGKNASNVGSPQLAMQTLSRAFRSPNLSRAGIKTPV